jgi:PBP1b-binding outer membrane lipoprotein LpoB
MKHYLKLVFITIAAFFLFSCGDALKEKYSKKTAEGDLERIAAIKRLDSADYELMTNYMLKNGLIDPDLKHIDQSYAEILMEARRDKLKQEKLKAHSKLKVT